MIAGFWWTVLAAGLPCCVISTVMCLVFCDPNTFEEQIKIMEISDQKYIAHRIIVFRGKVLPGTGKCVCSWPATGQLLVRSPLWGTQAMGLTLVDKVDSKHRTCTWGRGRNGGVLFKGMNGEGKVRGFSTAGEEHLRREAIQDKKQDFVQSRSFLKTLPLSIRGRYSVSFWRGFQRKNATSWRHPKVLGIRRRPK